MKIRWSGDGKFYLFSDMLGDDIEYKFYIYNDYKKVPTFHIIPSNECMDFCICMESASYYQASGIVYKYFAPEEIDRFLREYYGNGQTNWERMIDIAKYCYKNYKGNPQPDYSKLNENPIARRGFIDAIKSKWNA